MSDSYSPKSVIWTSVAAFGVVALLIVFYSKVYVDQLSHIGFPHKWTSTDHYSSGIKIIYDPLSCKASYCDDQYPIPKGKELIGYYGKSLQYQYSFPIHRSHDVQLLFDQGIMQLYGFNHAEASRNFEAAIYEDAECAMCYWGLAFSKTANINSESNEVDARAGRKAIDQAIKMLNMYPNQHEKLEQRLILAMNELFPQDSDGWSIELQHHLNQNYIDAMSVLYHDYSRNVDVKSYYAESLINTTPWKYYEDDKMTLLPVVVIANQALIEALDISEHKHPLALHLYIHVTEQSLTPVLGKLAADSLSSISGAEGTGHLSHMPSHTYFRIGSYDECIRSSLRAIEVDTYYASKCLSTYFPMHNMALLVSCAISSGRHYTAIEHSFDIAHTDDCVAKYGHELFPWPKELILVRFGRWKTAAQMLGIPLPSSSSEIVNDGRELDQNVITNRPIFLQVMSQYARTLVMIHTGFMHVIDKELHYLSHLVKQIPADTTPADHPLYPYHREIGYLFNATAYASANVMQGKLYDAIDIMLPATALQASFKYMEPEYFYLPTKQCLAAVELAVSEKQTSLSIDDRLAYAMKAHDTYISDLEDHPRNGWSVYGLMQTLIQQRSLLPHESHYPSALKGRMLRQLSSEVSWNSTIAWRDMSISQLKELFQRVWLKEGKPISGSCCEFGFC